MKHLAFKTAAWCYILFVILFTNSQERISAWILSCNWMNEGYLFDNYTLKFNHNFRRVHKNTKLDLLIHYMCISVEVTRNPLGEMSRNLTSIFLKYLWKNKSSSFEIWQACRLFCKRRIWSYHKIWSVLLKIRNNCRKHFTKINAEHTLFNFSIIFSYLK
jgi:hypothetical protein